MAEQPSGVVTLLFTDIEGSTRLLHELGAETYREALADHRSTLRTAFERHGGYEVNYEGDTFFVAFADAAEAIAAAAEAQKALEGGPIRVRIGVHTGTPILDPPKYVGADVHLAARVMSAGHGGQVLLTAATRGAVESINGRSLGELGEHRLKDIRAPVQLFQLGETRFPPLRTISNTNLRRPASSFVGRERETAEVVRLLGSSRLVTLTGPGGAGKTRLAIEAAAELVPDVGAGVFWVGLAALHDPALAVEAISQTLGAANGLAEHIGERDLLLLLDNFEQIVEAAPELSSLLGACPNLRLLVTSRELLRIDGEVDYAVPPLSQSEAVELFSARSRLEPDAATAELCRRLDNLPLAVELAAARTRVLSPAQILDRLGRRLDLLTGGRDAEPRRRTLRATIEWSYDLLDEAERGLLARLSVFVAGCTLEAAEQVAGADLDTLQSLLDKSLLERRDDGSEPRFTMLETIREYALDRLGESGEADEIRRRELAWLVGLAESIEPHVRSERGPALLDRLAEDYENMREALPSAVALGELEPAARLAQALEKFWLLRRPAREALTLVTPLAEALPADSLERAHCLRIVTNALFQMGDIETAATFAAEALAMARAKGDRRGVSSALNQAALLAIELGEIERAEELVAENMALVRELGDESRIGTTIAALANVCAGRGDHERALELFEEAVEIARRVGNRELQTFTLSNIGLIAAELGDVGRAVDALRESLGLALELRFTEAAAYSLLGLAAADGQGSERSVTILAASKGLADELGVTFQAAERELYERTLERLRFVAGFEALWERGRAMPLEEAVQFALRPPSRSKEN